MSQVKPIAILLAAAFTLAAAPAPRKANWNAAAAVTPAGSHTLGNPAAKVKLTIWASYTCHHCAHFEEEADTLLRTFYIAPGKLQIEVRHLVRDPVDLTVAMLTNCGPVAKFFLNHTAFLRSQDAWIGTLASPTAAQRTRWTTGSNLARRQAIATDFRFYAIMQTRGYVRASTDRCLADEAMANRLAAMTQDATQRGVNSTPGFAIDGTLLAGTNDWETLRLQLDART